LGGFWKVLRFFITGIAALGRFYVAKQPARGLLGYGLVI
jgi:hypothetical protein